MKYFFKHRFWNSGNCISRYLPHNFLISLAQIEKQIPRQDDAIWHIDKIGNFTNGRYLLGVR